MYFWKWLLQYNCHNMIKQWLRLSYEYRKKLAFLNMRGLHRPRKPTCIILKLYTAWVCLGLLYFRDNYSLCSDLSFVCGPHIFVWGLTLIVLTINLGAAVETWNEDLLWNTPLLDFLFTVNGFCRSEEVKPVFIQEQEWRWQEWFYCVDYSLNVRTWQITLLKYLLFMYNTTKACLGTEV